ATPAAPCLFRIAIISSFCIARRNASDFFQEPFDVNEIGIRLLPCYAGSNMIQATVEVSVPLEDRIVNEVPAVLALTRRKPGVPPGVLQHKKMRELAVTAVVLTTTVPPTRV